MKEIYSTEKSPTESYQRLIRSIIYALTIVSAVRGLIVYGHIWQSLLWPLVPMIVVLVTERRVINYGFITRTLYIAVQLGLVCLLYWLARYADFWALLLLPACHVIPRLFEDFYSHILFGAVCMTMFACLWFAESGVTSLLFSSIYFVAFIMVYAFSRIIIQLEQARWEAESLSQQLQTANQQLRDYAQQSAESATQVARQQVARDLHDSVTQTLFSINLMLSTLLTKPKALPTSVTQELNTLQGLAESAMKELRGIIGHLQPVKKVNLPFHARLNLIFNELKKHAVLQIHLTMDDDFNLPHYAQNSLLRFIQEALVNIAKHAQTDTAEVVLQKDQGRIHVQIIDQGKGFDVATANKPGHIGMNLIRQHALELGGELKISSVTEKGTCIALILPSYVGERLR